MGRADPMSAAEIAVAPPLVDVSFADQRLATLYRRHFGAVTRWVRSLGVPPEEAEDGAQEVFLVAHRRLSHLRDDASASAWLFGIVRGVAANRRRRRRRAQRREGSYAQERPREEADLDDVVDSRRAAERMQAYLDALPEKYRLPFLLYDLEDRPAPEVARMLGIGTEAVYARVRVARRRLTRLVRAHGPDIGGDP